MAAEQSADPARMRAFAQVCALLNPFRGAQPPEPSANTDWIAVEEFVNFHGVRPALHKALSALPATARAPAAMLDRLATFQRGHRFRVMQTTAQIVALAQGFEAAGITALFFKGAMLGEQIYGGAQYREFNDVDVLVAPAQRRRAEQMLEALGFAPVIAERAFRAAFFDYFRQHNFKHQPSGTTVDFHWGFVGTGPFPISVEKALASADNLQLADTSILVPPPQAQALILAGHGHKENWASFGWVLDFATFAAGNRALDWVSVAKFAHSQECLEPLLGAVWLTQRVFGVTIDQALLDGAAQRPVIDSNAGAVIVKLATLAERQLADDLMSGFHLCETPRQRAAMALSLITTPTIGDYEALPLSPRWWWMYRATRPIRLALRTLSRRAPRPSKFWARANPPRA